VLLPRCTCRVVASFVGPLIFPPPPLSPPVASENGVEIPRTTVTGLGVGLEVMEGFSDHEIDGDGATSPVHSPAAIA